MTFMKEKTGREYYKDAILVAWPAVLEAFGFGIYGVWIGVIVDQVIRLSFTMMRFKSGKWTKIVI